MSTIPPKKKPAAPGTKPPNDFDEEAPTAVVPGKQPRPMPRQFDPGGDLEDEVTGVATDPRKGGKLPPDEPGDDDTAPTKDS